MKKILIGVFITVLVLVMGIPLWVFRDYPGGWQKKSGRTPVVRVLNKKTGEIMTLPIEEYLVGVVAAEMPANFSLEALKAQAVAARTYTARRMFAYGAKPVDSHGGAEICTNPVHCQAWCDTGELKAKWGRLKYFYYMEKVRKAVRQTRGQVITYNNALIEPVYHASCGGRGTENSEDVWAETIPYLRGVPCRAEYRVQEHVYSLEADRQDLLLAMKKGGFNAPAAGVNSGPDIIAVKKSPRGRLKEVKLFGQTITGTQFRQVTGLTSTLVAWQDTGGKIRLTSWGKGHAVGLCQYGANGLALAGKDYRDIISHYYTGVKVQILRY